MEADIENDSVAVLSYIYTSTDTTSIIIKFEECEEDDCNELS